MNITAAIEHVKTAINLGNNSYVVSVTATHTEARIAFRSSSFALAGVVRAVAEVGARSRCALRAEFDGDVVVIRTNPAT